MGDKVKKSIGKAGEIAATKFLIKNNFNIIQVNYKTKVGEIDIICEDENYIVFVEVKTRKKGALAPGVYAVNKKKRYNIFKVASQYIHDKNIHKQPRFDIIEVEHNVVDNSYCVVNHYEDAFWQGGSYGVF